MQYTKTVVAILAVALAGTITGCAIDDLVTAAGGKASARCIQGGPNPAVGGIVASARVAEDFTGTVVVDPTCGVLIEAE